MNRLLQAGKESLRARKEITSQSETDVKALTIEIVEAGGSISSILPPASTTQSRGFDAVSDAEVISLRALTDEEAEGIYSYAFAHYQSGHFEEAASAFNVLCTRRPFEARFWFGLGASLQEKGMYLDALHAWAMRGLLDPQDPYPHFHAAECYLSLDNLQDAKKALDEAILRIDSSHPLFGKIESIKKQKEI